MAYGLGAGLAQGFVRGYEMAEQGKEREQKLRLQEETATRDRERYQREVADREAAERIQAGLRLLATAKTPEELDVVEGVYSGKVNWKDLKPGGQKAGITAPATGEAPPPATGVQTFPIGTQPGTPLTYTDEAGAPLPSGGPAPSSAPASAPASPPDSIFIPNHRGDPKLRDRMYDLSERGYQQLALLNKDYKTAAALPALTKELKSKDWDMEAGPMILAASQGSAPAAREVLKMIPGMDGVKVPDNFKVERNGTLMLEKDGQPFPVSPQTMLALAGKFKSPTDMLKTFVDMRRNEQSDERAAALNTATVGLRESQAGLADAQSDYYTSRADRLDNPTPPTVKPDKLEEIRKKGLSQIQSLVPVKTASEDEMRAWSPVERGNYDFGIRKRNVAASIFNDNIGPDGTANVPADVAVQIASVLGDPVKLAADMNAARKPGDKSALEQKLRAARQTRDELMSRVQKDEKGSFIVINGKRINVPAPR